MRWEINVPLRIVFLFVGDEIILALPFDALSEYGLCVYDRANNNKML